MARLRSPVYIRSELDRSWLGKHGGRGSASLKFGERFGELHLGWESWFIGWSQLNEPLVQLGVGSQSQCSVVDQLCFGCIGSRRYHFYRTELPLLGFLGSLRLGQDTVLLLNSLDS